MWMFSEFQFLIPSQLAEKSSSRRPIYLFIDVSAAVVSDDDFDV
jgi:hypothetical protein